MALIPFLAGLDFKPILELRARVERRDDNDFSRAKDDDMTNLLGRVRAGFGIGKDSLKGQFVYQYSYGEEYNFNTHIGANRSDLLLGNVQDKFGRAGLILGRQRLNFGDERLLGVADWNNVSNAWDGGRFSLGQGELFAVKSGLLLTPNNDLTLYGGAYTWGPVQALSVYKHDDRNEVNEETLSFLYKGQVGRIGIDAEAAGQVGHRLDENKLAGAANVIGTVPLASKLSFSAQGSIASGGHHGDTTNTFDQLYPSGHDQHGLLDMAGWENIRDLGLWLRYRPDRATSLKLEYHALGLDSARDAWYGSGGRPNKGPKGAFIDPTGRSGRDVGDEFDLDCSRSLDPRQTVRAGAGIFQPGHFVRAFNGDSTKDQVFGYVQYTYRF